MKTKKADDTFGSLVENAFAFLRAALADLKAAPKYSVINFYAAVELLFKARLLREHWTLIVQHPDKANKTAFANGDFFSVNLVEAAERICSVCGSRPLKRELDCFAAIRSHRNRLVHFYHKEYTRSNRKVIEQIVIEQCRGWYLIHQLLTKGWRPHFDRYSATIRKLDQGFREHRAFFKARFADIKVEMAKKEKEGVAFADCELCGFPTAEVVQEHPPVKGYRCLVCEQFTYSVTVHCPHCRTQIEINHGNDLCPKCNKEVSAEAMAGQFSQPFEDKVGREQVFCACCGLGNVMTLKDGTFYCPDCEEIHESAANCEFCNSLVAGLDPERITYAYGCGVCDGAIAWQASKED